MPQTQIVWHGLSEWKEALRNTEANIDRANRSAVVALGALAEREAKSNFSGSHKRGRPHVGGARPNVVTGNLRRSIQSTAPVQYAPHSYLVRVAPNTAYMRAVELGRPGHSGAFPYFAPAIKVVRLRAEAVLAEAWSKYI